MVPTAALLLLHVPPEMELESERLASWQTLLPPVMGAVALTVTIAFEVQPAPVVYVIPEVPPVTPVTAPEVAFTVATEVVPLVHAPPAGALDSVTLDDGHTVNVPVTGEMAFTFTVVTR